MLIFGYMAVSLLKEIVWNLQKKPQNILNISTNY